MGITSDGEYFDIDVNTTESTEKSIAALNAQMVDGGEVTGYVLLPDDAKKAMSLVAAADYVLSFKEGYENPYTTDEWKEAIDKHFFDEPSFVVMKKTKKSEREVDIKPLVYKLTVMENNKKPEFFMQLSTGSIDNIKPEFVLQAIYEKCGLDYNPLAIQIHRQEVYARKDDGTLICLLDMGEEIS